MPDDILPGCQADSPIPDYMGPLSQAGGILSSAQGAIRQTVVSALASAQSALDGAKATMQAGIVSRLQDAVNVLEAARIELDGSLQSSMANALTTAQEMGVQLPASARYLNVSGQPEMAIATGEVQADGMGQWVMPDGTSETASIQDIVSRGIIAIRDAPVHMACQAGYDQNGWANGTTGNNVNLLWNTDPPEWGRVQEGNTSGFFRFSQRQVATGYIVLDTPCSVSPHVVVDPWVGPHVDPPAPPPVEPPVLPPLPPDPFHPPEPPVLPPPVEPPVDRPCPPCPPTKVTCPAPVVNVVCGPGGPVSYPPGQPPTYPPVSPPVAEPPEEKPPEKPEIQHNCPDNPDYHIQVCPNWTVAGFEELLPGMGEIMAGTYSGWDLMEKALEPEEYPLSKEFMHG